MKTSSIKILFLISFLCLSIAFTSSTLQDKPQNIENKLTGKANPDNLQRRYVQWLQKKQQQNDKTTLNISLQFARAFTRNKQNYSGHIAIDLLNGNVEGRVSGLPSQHQYQVVMQGQNANSNEQSTIMLGLLKPDEQAIFHLETQLERFALNGFHLNRIVVQETSRTQVEALLAGSPSLFQRIYFSNKQWTITKLNHTAAKTDNTQLPYSFLLPTPAFAAIEPDAEALRFDQLVADGRDIFKNETFDGNGRTCSTCHRLDNNHTLDPKYIAKLPDDDPLFVAETNPDLEKLENPKLMRQLGLILANIDGFDKPGVFRGIPHLLAMNTSIAPEQEFEGQEVVHALGWSADGSIGDGSLRMFTIGAVVQHMPKTLKRIENEDFRLPDEYELDALEAYMLSLGRMSDPELDELFFTSPVVQRGRELFHSKEQGTGQCKGCHLNGGANSSTSLENGNRNTGVENMPDNPAILVWEPTPIDGGFGTEEKDNCGWMSRKTCYGNHEFNMTTVIEAADTAPFFHNNSVSTIEEAVAFYNSDAFHHSPGANPASPDEPFSVCERCIHLEPTQVISVALFLRTINAMENIRSSNQLDYQAGHQDELNKEEREELLRIAISETEDAIEVLEGGAIIPYAESVKILREAQKQEEYALFLQKVTFNLRGRERYKKYLSLAMDLKQQAYDLMLDENTSAQIQ